MPIPLNTAGAAEIWLAIAAVHSPTVSPSLAMLEVPTYPAPSKAMPRGTSTIETGFQSATVVKFNESRAEVTRPTTHREKVIGEMRMWNLLAANWDGEGAAEPVAESIRNAVSFVRLLPGKIELPEPMLLASGNSALYWNDTNVYADVEFFGDGRVAYFIKKNGDKHKGVITKFDSEKVPEVLSVLLTT